MALAGEYGFPAWVVVGTVLRGWAQVAQGERGEGLALMRRGGRELQTLGAGFGRLRCPAMLAAALAENGLTAEAQAVMGHTGAGTVSFRRGSRCWSVSGTPTSFVVSEGRSPLSFAWMLSQGGL